MTDTTEHTPGKLRVFGKNSQTDRYHEIDQVDPSEIHQCGIPIPNFILGGPPKLVLCERCAQKNGMPGYW